MFAAAAALNAQGASRRGLAWQKVVVVSLATIAAFGCGLAAVADDAVLSEHYQVTERIPAPGGAARQVVVERGTDGSGPIWTIYVDTGRGLTRHRWPAACFVEGDAEYKSAAWISPSEILLTSEENGTFTLDLDHAGHPATTGVSSDVQCSTVG